MILKLYYSVRFSKGITFPRIELVVDSVTVATELESIV